jgi:AcrR family transcriptional regulator
MENIAEKKKAILESTLELIKQNGFHGTPMSLVAQKACVACGTIYHYFDSKDTLITELYAYVKQKMENAMLEGDDTRMEFKDRFFNFWIKHCRFYMENPNALYFMEQYVNSPYHKDSKTEDERFRNVILNFVKAGIEKGTLKQMNYLLMGILIHSSVATTVKIHLSGKVNIGEAEMHQMAQVIWDGIKSK